MSRDPRLDGELLIPSSCLPLVLLAWSNTWAGVYQGSESELDHLWKANLAMHRPRLRRCGHACLGALPRVAASHCCAAASWGNDLHRGPAVCPSVLAAVGKVTLTRVV